MCGKLAGPHCANVNNAPAAPFLIRRICCNLPRGTPKIAAMEHLTPGLTGTAEMIVGSNDTAPRVGSGRIAVLATPVMINLVEEAALAAFEHLLDAGQQSLGTHLDISHIAATPTGMRVEAQAELTSIDGRKLTFAIRVHDEVDRIAEGTHTRVVVSAARFQDRVDAKATR